MMPRYDFTARAVEDLREINRYTEKEWGSKQARLYHEELELALQKLSLNPNLGRSREEVGHGIRSFRIASHIAFYLPREGGLTVIRLLHPGRDIELAFEHVVKKPNERER